MDKVVDKSSKSAFSWAAKLSAVLLSIAGAIVATIFFWPRGEEEDPGVVLETPTQKLDYIRNIESNIAGGSLAEVLERSPEVVEDDAFIAGLLYSVQSDESCRALIQLLIDKTPERLRKPIRYNDYYTTIAHVLANDGQTDALTALLEYDPTLAETNATVPGCSGNLLHVAAATGNKEVLLLVAKMNPIAIQLENAASRNSIHYLFHHKRLWDDDVLLSVLREINSTLEAAEIPTLNEHRTPAGESYLEFLEGNEQIDGEFKQKLAPILLPRSKDNPDFGFLGESPLNTPLIASVTRQSFTR